MKRYFELFTLSFVILLAACSPQAPAISPTAQPTIPATAQIAAETATPVPPLSPEQLQTMQIPAIGFDSEQNVTLKDGKFDNQDANNPLLVSFGGQFASGDLNGDQTPDAVMVVGSNTGGSGVFIQLNAVLNQNGQPQSAGAIMLGDRVRVTDLSIENGVIILNFLVQGLNDPMCCPTEKVHATYSLLDGALTNTEQQIVATGLPQFNDPFAYCAAMGTVDGIEAHYSGPQMTETIAKWFSR